jgi:sigma-E factor negative regulatory protein RseB
LLRVSHRVDGKTERQKIEVLDGPHREFIRINDEVYCHLADGKTVRVDKSAVQRFFPSVVPDDADKLALYYIPKLGGGEKISGRECQIVILEPRDQYRYTHMIWIDRATALPLKMQTVDRRGAPVSMFGFAEIEIGPQPDKALFDVRMAGKRMKAAGFAASMQDDGWAVSPPPGYVRILEAMRPLPGIKSPVLHSVYSDGMSNLSVFIEPVLDGGAGMEGLSTEGAMNIYARKVGGHKVTALGEVPAAALLETANSVQKK